MDSITQSFLEEIDKCNIGDGVIDRSKLAESLAGKVQRFMKWLIVDQEIFMGELCEELIINDNIYVDGKKLKTLPDLWKYFCDNIEKEK